VKPFFIFLSFYTALRPNKQHVGFGSEGKAEIVAKKKKKKKRERHLSLKNGQQTKRNCGSTSDKQMKKLFAINENLLLVA